MRHSDVLEMGAMVGIDPASDGLERAERLGVATTARGDRRSAGAGRCGPRSASSSTPPRPARICTITPSARRHGKVDDRPDPGGDRAVCQSRSVNWRRASRRAQRQHGHLRRPGDDPDRRRGQLGGQGALCARSSPRSHRSRPGPGTRANIDEFTETTAPAIERSAAPTHGQGDHRAQSGRAAADHARHRVLLCPTGANEDDITRLDRRKWSAEVQAYVPGYRLKQEVQFERFGSNNPVHIPGLGAVRPA